MFDFGMRIQQLRMDRNMSQEALGKKLGRSKSVVCGYENNANNLCMDACVRVGESEKGTWLPVLTDAAETARITGTISYEVLCAATRRAEMVYDNATFCGR